MPPKQPHANQQNSNRNRWLPLLDGTNGGPNSKYIVGFTPVDEATNPPNSTYSTNSTSSSEHKATGPQSHVEPLPEKEGLCFIKAVSDCFRSRDDKPRCALAGYDTSNKHTTSYSCHVEIVHVYYSIRLGVVCSNNDDGTFGTNGLSWNCGVANNKAYYMELGRNNGSGSSIRQGYAYTLSTTW